jgi:hypothetical protein
MKVKGSEMEDAEEYPWEHVNASRKNERLQRRHSVSAAKERYLIRAKSCPKCGAQADGLAWFYFDSPLETWKNALRLRRLDDRLRRMPCAGRFFRGSDELNGETKC